MDSTITPLPVGTELGDEFRVEKNLGQGGFGITYLVRALKDIEDLVETGSLYVVKEFAMNGYVRRADDSARITPLGDDDATREQTWALFTKFRDSFRQEALTMAMFQHRNIVEVLLVRSANETAYIIMEYINGDALLDRVMESIRLKRRGMSWPELEPIAHQTLEALEYIHFRDIIHRDIKPDNIMLRRNGDAVLIDFGGARPKARANMSIVYTPGFAPAEQFPKSPDDDLPEVSRTTDIFSLAASFYMAMTGETPYTLDERRMPVAAREPLLGHSHQQTLQIPDGVARAIDWALNFGDPTKRPQSVEDWRRAFPPKGQVISPQTPPSPTPQTPPQQTVNLDLPTADNTTVTNTLVREEIKKSRVSTMLGLTMAGVATIAALGALAAFYFFDSNPAQPYAARVTIDETWVSLGDAIQSAGLPIRGEDAISAIQGLTLSELENSERTTTMALSSDEPFRIRFEQAGETLVMLIAEGSDFPKLSSGQLSNLEVRAEDGEAELYLVNSDFVDSLS